MKSICLLPILVGVAASMTACNQREAATETTTTTTTTTASAMPQASTSASVVTRASFDCNRALPGGETAVCANPEVAELDVELARLYKVVDAKVSDAERSTLHRLQGGWLQKRDACADTVDVKACLKTAYTDRIADLRAGYAPARADTAGISAGPVSWRCPGTTKLMTSTFVNSTTPVVILKRDDSSVVLTGSAAASGARYQSATPDGAYEFWTKGSETQLTVPGSATVTCSLSDTAAG